MTKRDILLHTCCAPCFSYTYEVLKDSFHVVPYYYNPNISPEREYRKRLSELENFTRQLNLDLHIGNYDIRRWTERIKPFRFLGERSERCWNCYQFRLEGSFQFALKNGFEIVTTVLSISPHKDASVINRIGKELEMKYNVEFLEADFKKNNGFKKSVELSRRYGFYRQSYCGCIYSKMERDKNSIWYKKYVL